MRKIVISGEGARYIGTCALLAAVGVGLFHAYNEDLLLLATDLPTLLVYLGFMQLAATVTTCAILSFYWLLPRTTRLRVQAVALHLLTAGALLVVAQAFLALLTLSPPFMALYRGVFGLATRLAVKPLILDHIGAIELVGLIGIIWAIRGSHDMHRRAATLGIVLLGGAVLAMSFGYLLLPSRGPHLSRGPARHVVLIVLDGLGNDVMHEVRTAPAGDPLAATPPDVATNLITAFPYTSGFFGALYTGRLNCQPSRDNLLGALEQAGVRVRWLSFHRNGYPDTSGCQVHAYRGLRSYALTQRRALVPHMLGLDYEVALSGANGAAPQAVDDILLPQLKELFGRGDRAFAVIHVPGSSHTTNAYEPAEPDSLDALVRSADYTYPPQFEGAVRQRRQQFVHGAALVLKNVSRLVAALRADPQLANTVVLVTADHGTVFGGGHMYYGYQVDRPVLRTPLLVFGVNPAKFPTPDGPVFTPDLTRTILDLLGVKSDAGDGISLLSASPGHGEVGTLGVPASRSPRWLLAITDAQGDTKVFNLARDGDGKMIRLGSTGTFVESLTEEPTAPEIATVRRWLRAYGVSPGDVNARYR